MKPAMLHDTLFENIPDSNGTFVKHFHDTYTIGITHDGMFKSVNSQQSSLAYQNSTRIINPGEVHCGDSHAWKYTNFYPSTELLAKLYEQMYGEHKIPFFERHIIDNLPLFTLLLDFFRSVYYKKSGMEIDIALMNALSYLIVHYTSYTKQHAMLFDESFVTKISIEYIHDNLHSDITLEELSSQTHLSKYHFLRVFKKNIGLTPHQYIITERIHKAKELVLEGKSLGEVGFDVGFSDQSHFIRNFRKIYGYSPKLLLQKSNFILYK